MQIDNKNNYLDEIIDRKENKERRWDLPYLKSTHNLINIHDVYNSSIADLDFASPKAVREEIIKRANKLTYSYTYVYDETYIAIQKWYKELHRLNLNKAWIKVIHGTVNAMFQIIQTLTKENDSILIQTPIYKPFSRGINYNHRRIIENKLIYQNNSYKIDFDEFEKQIIEHQVKLFMFCNPHNPGGIQWKKEDIKKLIGICLKHNVYFFSDEVHGDLLLGNKMHHSVLEFEEIYPNLIVSNSPNKLFNLGGLKGSYMIVPDKDLLAIINETYEKNSITSPNIFFQPALIGAYNYDSSYEWRKDVLSYIASNFAILKKEFLDRYHFTYLNLEASYLVWFKFDTTKITINQYHQNLTKENLIVGDEQDFYGAEGNWIRLNIGCSKDALAIQIAKLKKVLEVNDENY